MSVRKWLIWALIALLAAIFALLWIAEGVGGTQPFDREGLVAIHQYVGTGSIQHGFADLSTVGYFRDYAWFLGAVLVGFLALRWFLDAIRLAFAYAGAEVTDLIVKRIAERSRPVEPWTLTHPHSFSFPSGHGVVSIAVFAFIGVLFALLLASSRLVLALHFPSDVLAGVVLGLIWVLLSSLLPLPRLKAR